ncbi:hypothetical protein [Salsipaludibacter albus]|uniref:hypothetical protein n=1 Tax=Salsipaludibacter albus TaxID=2849650 RepID=UPI001EE4E351|nr:hypothetical protein [Salsipaludibacter albus]MBY5164075.1 hypothetical protein [Salsipaludibacter albus]
MTTDATTRHSRRREDRAPRPSSPRRTWWTGAVALAALTFATHAANFGFTIAGGRLLPPADFGTLTALLGIVMVGMAPGMAVQALTAADTLGRPAVIDAPLARRLAATIAGIVAVLMLVLGPALETWDPVSVLAVSIAAGLLPLTAANEGLLQGRSRFAVLGLVLFTGAAVKLAAGIVGMVTTGTVWAAAVAIAVGYAAQLTLSHRLTGGLATPVGTARLRLSRTVTTAVVMMALLLVLIHTDAVMARILLDDLDAGMYAVGTTAMRIVFWAPQFVVLLLFPRLVTDPRRRVVAVALGGLTIAGAVGALAAALLGPFLADVVGVVFGEQYTAMGPELWRYAWLGTGAVGLQILTLSDLASGRRDALWLLAAALATIVATLLLVRPDTPVAIVTTVAAIVTGYVFVGFARRLTHATPAD